MSPYVVTTKRQSTGTQTVHTRVVSRKAVATLDEARDAMWAAARRSTFDPHEWNKPVNEVSESGGTVGPLPDGTVIEVERVNTFDLRVRTGQQHSGADPIAAFNAREAQS